MLTSEGPMRLSVGGSLIVITGKIMAHALICCLSCCAGVGAGFYLGYSWLPSFFTKHVGIPQSLTLWMVLSGMVIFTFVVPVSRRRGIYHVCIGS